MSDSLLSEEGGFTTITSLYLTPLKWPKESLFISNIHIDCVIFLSSEFCSKIIGLTKFCNSVNKCSQQKLKSVKLKEVNTALATSLWLADGIIECNGIMRNLSTRKKIKNGVYRPLSSRLNPQNNTETKILPTVLNIYMRYWPGVSSKGLNIGQVICCVFYRPRPCRGQQKRQKRPTTSHLDFTQGQQKSYYIAKKRTFSSGTRAGPILPARVANRNTGFASPCLLEDSTTDV